MREEGGEGESGNGEEQRESRGIRKERRGFLGGENLVMGRSRQRNSLSPEEGAIGIPVRVGEAQAGVLSSSIQPRGGSFQGDDSEMEFPSQSNQREPLPALGFEVAVIEALQEDKGDKEGQNEVDDRGGFMVKAVI